MESDEYSYGKYVDSILREEVSTRRKTESDVNSVNNTNTFGGDYINKSMILKYSRII